MHLFNKKQEKLAEYDWSLSLTHILDKIIEKLGHSFVCHQLLRHTEYLGYIRKSKQSVIKTKSKSGLKEEKTWYLVCGARHCWCRMWIVETSCVCLKLEPKCSPRWNLSISDFLDIGFNKLQTLIDWKRKSPTIHSSYSARDFENKDQKGIGSAGTAPFLWKMMQRHLRFMLWLPLPYLIHLILMFKISWRSGWGKI